MSFSSPFPTLAMPSLNQRRLAYHGAIVFLVSLIAGTVFMVALVFNWDAEAVRGWGAAHRAPLVMGVWMIAVAAILPNLILTQWAARTVVSTLVWGVYMITIACWLAALGHVRGLAFSGPAINIVSWSINGVGGILTLVGATLVVIGARNAMRLAPPASQS